jgi:allantoicase
MNATVSAAPQGSHQHFFVPFTELLDLASEKVGGKALYANDDFFAPKENLLKAEPPVFIADKYTEFGKWMDGWESRRKRNIGPGNDRDTCIIRLGIAGTISGLDVDTSFFTGNYPEYCSIDAMECVLDEQALDAGAKWISLVSKSKLQGGSHNFFSVHDGRRFTHLRLTIFPDGGVARLRVHGRPAVDFKTAGQLDLAAAANGGSVVSCNDSFFGPKDNLILTGRARNMGEGWETRRKRGPGNDWIIVRLATSGRVQKIEVDTNHFKGNFPESCSVDACWVEGEPLLPADFRDRKDIQWVEVLSRTQLQAHHQHFFEKELSAAAGSGKFNYVRLNIYPDGGVSRLRVYGVRA